MKEASNSLDLLIEQALNKLKEYNIDLNDIEAHNEALEYAENLDAWELQTVVGHKKNRFLSYPCSQYHSKYPNITEESRIVCVIFYKYEGK